MSTSTAAPGGVLLLVEDEDSIGRLVKTYLEQQDGWRVLWLRSGEEAVTELRRHAVRLVILDIGLPGIDGFEVARRVRADASLRNVMLVALTGYGRSEDRERARAAGFDRYLVKPIGSEALRSLIASVSERERL